MSTKVFDSYEEFLAFVKSVPHNKRVDHSASWAGGSYEQALRLAGNGDSAIVKRAENIFLDIEHVLLPSIETYEIEPYYYGQRPNMSAVLSGQPKSMHRRQYTAKPSQQGPIRIYFDRFSSAGYSASDITSRGVAVLALVLALKRMRHVTLYIGEAINTYGRGHVVWATALELNHIDLAVLANAVAGASFYRALGFTVNSVANGDYAGNKLSAEQIRKKLDWSENDVIFEGLASSDSDAKLSISNPIAWVKKRLSEINNDGDNPIQTI